MLSRSTARSAGSPPAGARSPSGTGCTQMLSGSASPSCVEDGTGAERSIGRARRCPLRSMSRHTLVAMRYSQDRNAERPSNRSRARQARTRVSCTASSASKVEPSIR